MVEGGGFWFWFFFSSEEEKEKRGEIFPENPGGKKEGEKARKRKREKKTPALTSVADPFPALACTTSVPPSCVRAVRASSFEPRSLIGVAWENSGRIVTPAWPPTTGTSTPATSSPVAPA